MGADNWGICPKCAKEVLYDLDVLDDTFKEYWDIGIDVEGAPELNIYYHGTCTECGFDFKYEKTIDIPIGENK